MDFHVPAKQSFIRRLPSARISGAADSVPSGLAEHRIEQGVCLRQLLLKYVHARTNLPHIGRQTVQAHDLVTFDQCERPLRLYRGHVFPAGLVTGTFPSQPLSFIRSLQCLLQLIHPSVKDVDPLEHLAASLPSDRARFGGRVRTRRLCRSILHKTHPLRLTHLSVPGWLKFSQRSLDSP